MTQLTGANSDLDLPELAQLDSDEEQRLSTLLRSAFAPAALEFARHERLLRAALEDPFAPASIEELVESERLRQALDGNGDGDGEHLDLVLARALSVAHAPSKGLPKARPSVLSLAAERPPARVLFLRFAGIAATLAAAAAVLLAVTSRPSMHDASAPELPVLALAQSRSTAALIQVDAAGAPSTRIDRIASTRGRELRDNRYALWGVR